MPYSIDENFDQLLKLISEHISEPNRSKFITMLLSLAEDTFEVGPGSNQRTLLGFRRSPAAKGYHHAREGGLVEHLLEMWDIYLRMDRAFPQLNQPPIITSERVLTAIICHDLHKGYRTYIRTYSNQFECFDCKKLCAKEGVSFVCRNSNCVSVGLVISHEDATPWQVESAYDRSDNLLTRDMKSLWLLNQYGISLDLEQMNAFLLAEGGFSKTQPRSETVLAKFCYLLDEMSGNILDRIYQGKLSKDNQDRRI